MAIYYSSSNRINQINHRHRCRRFAAAAIIPESYTQTRWCWVAWKKSGGTVLNDLLERKTEFPFVRRVVSRSSTYNKVHKPTSARTLHAFRYVRPHHASIIQTVGKSFPIRRSLFSRCLQIDYIYILKCCVKSSHETSFIALGSFPYHGLTFACTQRGIRTGG